MMLTALLLSLMSVHVLDKSGADAFTSSASRCKSKRSFEERRIPTHMFVSGNDDSDKSGTTEKIRAAVYQAPSQSVLPDNPLAKLMQIADSLRVAANHGVDLVVYPELYLSGSNKDAIDRECQELGIVANICGELGVACAIGYAEKMSQAEAKCTSSSAGDKSVYNAVAAFNADGSRAGNYRSISTNESFLEGQPFVESIPIRIQLPTRQEEKEREIRLGLMCGADSTVPEHSRQLVRSGAKALIALGYFKNVGFDQRVVDCVLPSRAMENEVPLLFANPEGSDPSANGEKEFIGSSAIIACDGDYLACAPQEEGGDLPLDVGYLLPCETGALYAADIEIDLQSQTASTLQQLMDKWDLTPKVPDVVDKKEKVLSKELRGTSGFAKR